MNEVSNVIAPVFWRKHKWVILGVSGSLLAAILWPYQFADTVAFVLMGMLEVSPLVIPGILISAWVNASGAGGRIRQAFEGNQFKAILVASAIGAITPVCGVTVLPLMAGLLSSGVPLATGKSYLQTHRAWDWHPQNLTRRGGPHSLCICSYLSA